SACCRRSGLATSCVTSVSALTWRGEIRMPSASGGALQGNDLLFHGWRKIHKYKKTLMIQIILATLIDDPHQIVQRRSRIGKDPVDLPWDKGRLIAAVIDTKSEGFRR